MRRLIISILILCFVSSYDCVQNVSGIVTDSKDNQPLRNVLVYNKNKPSNKTITDSLGHFRLSSISGGLRGCPPMTIVIEYDGFKKTEIAIPAGGNKTVKLHKVSF